MVLQNSVEGGRDRGKVPGVVFSVFGGFANAGRQEGAADAAEGSGGAEFENGDGQISYSGTQVTF